MFKKITNGCVRMVSRWLPDPFIFAVILSIVVYIAALFATKMGPLEILSAWGGSTGFWSLLSFSMQMACVLVFGSAMASSRPVKALLKKIAGLAHNNFQAIFVTAFISTICCWLNWGFGLIVGALLAKEVVRRVPSVDYPLLIASAYSGFVIWHAGLSGSIPLALNSGYTIFAGTESEMTFNASTSTTIFHPMNLIMCLVILFVMPFVLYAMHPHKDKVITVDPKLLVDEEELKHERKTPADKMEQSKILWIILCAAGVAYVIYYFVTSGQKGKSVVASLDLNTVNFIFLTLGLICHGSLRSYIDAIEESVKGAAGIILQFPFYAGIMGMMVAANAEGVSLAGVISNFFVNISNELTFPLLTFLSAGIVNFFVPSGGGQWAVQGPIVMPAAAAMGIEPGRAAMAIAWGDQWTNMIQPFWALPALGVAKLTAKDIMGYLVIILVFTGLVACGGFLCWAAFF